MMKKILVLMLVLGMASLANAAIISVTTDGLGDYGNAGTTATPLADGETIALQIILEHNAYPSWSSYDGYVLDAMNVDLHVSGSGSLGVVMKTTKTGDVTDLKHHAGFDVWSESNPLIVSNQIASMMGGSLGYILGSAGANGTGPASPPTQLVWDLYVTNTGSGSSISIDLTLGGSTHYWDYSDPSGNAYPTASDKYATEGDLGDLTIYTVPEPATVALLGLGGLLLLRRRRR
ncbi:MAG: PEP-CTERM sorting domain-containing protein [Planctomycetota bacterium]